MQTLPGLPLAWSPSSVPWPSSWRASSQLSFSWPPLRRPFSWQASAARRPSSSQVSSLLALARSGELLLLLASFFLCGFLRSFFLRCHACTPSRVDESYCSTTPQPLRAGHPTDGRIARAVEFFDEVRVSGARTRRERPRCGRVQSGPGRRRRYCRRGRLHRRSSRGGNQLHRFSRRLLRLRFRDSPFGLSPHCGWLRLAGRACPPCLLRNAPHLAARGGFLHHALRLRPLHASLRLGASGSLLLSSCLRCHVHAPVSLKERTNHSAKPAG